jgi:hypothetical protein
MTTLQKAKLAGFAFIVLVMFGAAMHTESHPQQTSALAQAQNEQAQAQMQGQVLTKIEPDAKIDEDVYPAGINLAVQMIRAKGWKCDSLSDITPFAMSRGFHVWCNKFNYGYEMEDRGGNWEVTLR